MGQDRVILPGFGQPLNDTLPTIEKEEGPYKGQRRRFPHALRDSCYSVGVSVRERRMLDFINKITDKPEWERKVFDEDIVGNWRSEACVHSEELDDYYLSTAMFDYCLEELRDKAAYFKDSQMVSAHDSETAIVKSDTAVSSILAESLRNNVRVLEDVPEHLKDWHPGSDQKVLDLLHPSLFPLIHGRSRALPYGTVPLDDCARFTGEGEVVVPEFDGYHIVQREDISLPEWGHFQWLPSNVEFNKDGTPKIVSYINNLHPRQHKELYGTLELFVAAAIPLWNECLSWDHTRLRIEFQGPSDKDFYIPDGVTFTPDEDDVESPEQVRPYTFQEANEHKDISATDAFDEWFRENRVFAEREPEPFRSRQQWEENAEHRPVDLQAQFATPGMQVIFKLANIHLTPEEPEYDGGTWHIEGAMNEHIVATALYYYDEENITPSHLEFRQAMDAEDFTYRLPQYEYASTEIFYGIENEEAAVQILGSVLTKPGRLLAFPNVLQHRVQSFKLADATKPGHRKILAMFLVDPYIRILSTANVPPQRKDWWTEEVRKVPPFRSLPLELFNMIIDEVRDFPLSWEEAVEVRQALMDERGALIDYTNDEIEESTFSFCEH
ncbi:hypothetical protein BDV38DRAFT_284334 [Aspergillus pseudotamarii]|uniref:Uncharacterized protein n=1 Tax=Aspergillus pseudotamarii TaxID=132259 RepID=A0A5N6SQS1_ASPPS|nr:uncharacterized protein BDV38DRAFT_284334 [Aspergillus pseudotamarii]KAE8136091.1 hypothetical protein BDV38DRAFT_284334 [Aspergillus pseudotamarii]